MKQRWRFSRLSTSMDFTVFAAVLQAGRRLGLFWQRVWLWRLGHCFDLAVGRPGCLTLNEQF
jgi:hypothetical protein